ncbi:MAG TPA: RidA family protein [Dyella sp.]|uniref:RidA family protein n=1 Tax=Dyella sp. TaxID=1869338 RepID=UPI002C2619F8|nr:RidA family protein [Dyella sp.]HTV86627.1 RidA family protein [Dyella sp.]
MRKLAICMLGLIPLATHAQDVTRYKLPNSNFPISAAVEVPAGKSLVFLSGQMASMPKDAKGGGGSAEALDTRAQTIGALENIKAQLESMHLSLRDVVKMNVYLVADKNKAGKLDFEGFMAGYTQFFGTKDQPNLPARSAVQVAALARPSALVEIEVIAVRP